jgi:hypothetical protein
MAFISTQYEQILQVNDLTRIDLSRTVLRPTETSFTSFSIMPNTGDSYIDVTTNRYLDFAYETKGDKVMTVKVVTNVATYTKTYNITVLSEEEDNLFSNDHQLVNFEDDILSYVRKGRSSFIDKHRSARDRILSELIQAGIKKNGGAYFSSSDVFDLQEVKDWALFKTLSMIFESLSNQVDDIFSAKAAKYKTMETQAKNTASLKLDFDSSSTLDDNENVNIISNRLVRR